MTGIHDYRGLWQALPDQPMIWLGGLLIFVYMLLRMRRGGKRERGVYQERGIRWFRKPSNRPAIYIIQSVTNPAHIKVGYTSRAVEKRMAEIASKRGPVTLLFSLRMPHAYAAEQTAHRALQANRRIRYLGGEWYRGDPARIRAITLRSAYKTRRRARLRLAWPDSSDIRVWYDRIS